MRFLLFSDLHYYPGVWDGICDNGEIKYNLDRHLSRNAEGDHAGKGIPIADADQKAAL